jgi:ATP-binding cassette subfamily E protein 1
VLTLPMQEDKCKPKKCKQECKKSCPVVRMGKQVHPLARTAQLHLSARVSLCC